MLFTKTNWPTSSCVPFSSSPSCFSSSASSSSSQSDRVVSTGVNQASPCHRRSSHSGSSRYSEFLAQLVNARLRPVGSTHDAFHCHLEQRPQLSRSRDCAVHPSRLGCRSTGRWRPRCPPHSSLCRIFYPQHRSWPPIPSQLASRSSARFGTRRLRLSTGHAPLLPLWIGPLRLDKPRNPPIRIRRPAGARSINNFAMPMQLSIMPFPHRPKCSLAPLPS